MIDRLVKLLFSWDRLRVAIFAEVDWSNSIGRTLNDPDSMKTASAFWCEEDGWRGWSIKDDGSYYFHDIPEHHLGDILDIVIKKEIVY
jgi:hypothetical protein